MLSIVKAIHNKDAVCDAKAGAIYCREKATGLLYKNTYCCESKLDRLQGLTATLLNSDLGNFKRRPHTAMRLHKGAATQVGEDSLNSHFSKQQTKVFGRRAPSLSG